MCFDYAMLSRQGSVTVKNALPAFRKALELKPDYVEARFQLGLMLVNTRDYAEAIVQLRQIAKVDVDDAQWYFPALAYAYLQTGDKEKARQNAEAAKKWAKTPAQVEHANALLQALRPAPESDERPTIRRVERSELSVTEPPPPANPFVAKDDKMSHVEGIAQRLDCSGQTARFHVLVGKTAMIFAIPDPSRVLIKHSDELKHDFTCGVQKPYKVAVDYAVLPDQKIGTAGIVRGLEF